MSIRRIRRAVREDHYEFTIHALEEMDEEVLQMLMCAKPFFKAE
jgi:hypothetical protein